MEINTDDTPIQQVDPTKFLGLLIDSNLSWNSHSQYVSKIISKYNSNIILKVRQFLPLHSLKALYNSLILPYLSYGAMIWADGPIPTIPTFILCFFNKNVSSVPVQSPSGLHMLIHFSHFFSTLKVQDMYKLQLASFMYQCNHQLLPPDHFFNVDASSHSCDTRHAHKPFITTITTVLAAIPPNLRAHNYVSTTNSP